MANSVDGPVTRSPKLAAKNSQPDSAAKSFSLFTKMPTKQEVQQDLHQQQKDIKSSIERINGQYTNILESLKDNIQNN